MIGLEQIAARRRSILQARAALAPQPLRGRVFVLDAWLARAVLSSRV
jgi:hypothetical protein